MSLNLRLGNYLIEQTNKNCIKAIDGENYKKFKKQGHFKLPFEIIGIKFAYILQFKNIYRTQDDENFRKALFQYSTSGAKRKLG